MVPGGLGRILYQVHLWWLTQGAVVTHFKEIEDEGTTENQGIIVATH
jgi:hypothetical protein